MSKSEIGGLEDLDPAYVLETLERVLRKLALIRELTIDPRPVGNANSDYVPVRSILQVLDDRCP